MKERFTYAVCQRGCEDHWVEDHKKPAEHTDDTCHDTWRCGESWTCPTQWSLIRYDEALANRAPSRMRAVQPEQRRLSGYGAGHGAFMECVDCGSLDWVGFPK